MAVPAPGGGLALVAEELTFPGPEIQPRRKRLLQRERRQASITLQPGLLLVAIPDRMPSHDGDDRIARRDWDSRQTSNHLFTPRLGHYRVYSLLSTGAARHGPSMPQMALTASTFRARIVAHPVLPTGKRREPVEIGIDRPATRSGISSVLQYAKRVHRLRPLRDSRSPAVTAAAFTVLRASRFRRDEESCCC